MTGVRPTARPRASRRPTTLSAATPTIVLTERVWQSRYRGDARVIGRDVLVNGTATAVIGVVSDRSGFPSGAGVFLPLAALPDVADAGRDGRTLQVFGRLAAPASSGRRLSRA